MHMDMHMHALLMRVESSGSPKQLLDDCILGPGRVHGARIRMHACAQRHMAHDRTQMRTPMRTPAHGPGTGIEACTCVAKDGVCGWHA